MDIFEHIMKEHREVEGMLRRLSEGYNEAVFNKLKLSLKAHMAAEEASLYPAMNDEEREMIQHATEEHRGVGKMLLELSRADKDGDAFTDGIEELTSILNDHVQEEEEEMIPKARDMFDESQIKDLSAKFDEVDEKISQKAT
jgi:hemerythrin superfamily protein